MRPCGIVKLPRLLTFLQEKSQSLQLQVQPLNAKLALRVASDDEALSQQEQHCKWSAKRAAPNSRNNGAWVYNQKARLLICDVTMHRLSERLRSLVSSCSNSA
jgi:outer membrane murein-binding lipoprotein Lpp